MVNKLMVRDFGSYFSLSVTNFSFSLLIFPLISFLCNFTYIWCQNCVEGHSLYLFLPSFIFIDRITAQILFTTYYVPSSRDILWYKNHRGDLVFMESEVQLGRQKIIINQEM